MLRFECDYGEGAAQPVLDLLQKTNLEQTPGYGEDEYCAAAADKIRTLCDAPDAAVHFFVGATQANLTVIDAALKPWQGVLCAETMLLIVSFPTGLVSLLIFVGIVWATRYVSLGSICGALIAPIGVLAACGKLPALLSLFCVILLVVKHRSNIGRLIRHQESKLSFKKDLSDKFDDEDF